MTLILSGRSPVWIIRSAAAVHVRRFINNCRCDGLTIRGHIDGRIVVEQLEGRVQIRPAIHRAGLVASSNIVVVFWCGQPFVVRDLLLLLVLLFLFWLPKLRLVEAARCNAVARCLEPIRALRRGRRANGGLSTDGCQPQKCICTPSTRSLAHPPRARKVWGTEPGSDPHQQRAVARCVARH